MNRVKLIIIDVDGTLTDGKIYMGNDGEVMKAFDIKDGFAFYKLLPDNDIVPVIITGRQSAIVENRCKELGITEIYQGCTDKKTKMLEIARQKGLEINSDGKIMGCAYIGDDILDIPGMEISEVVGCPSDAVDEVKNIADYVCTKNGGNGAFREFVEWLIRDNI